MAQITIPGISKACGPLTGDALKIVTSQPIPSLGVSTNPSEVNDVMESETNHGTLSITTPSLKDTQATS